MSSMPRVSVLNFLSKKQKQGDGFGAITMQERREFKHPPGVPASPVLFCKEGGLG